MYLIPKYAAIAAIMKIESIPPKAVPVFSYHLNLNS